MHLDISLLKRIDDPQTILGTAKCSIEPTAYQPVTRPQRLDDVLAGISLRKVDRTTRGLELDIDAEAPAQARFATLNVLLTSRCLLVE